MKSAQVRAFGAWSGYAYGSNGLGTYSLAESVVEAPYHLKISSVRPMCDDNVEASRSSPRFSRVSAACGAMAIVLGAMALLGWLTGLRRLAEIREGYIPMAPNTAVGMILCGLAILMFPGPGVKRVRGVAATALSGIAGLIASVRLLEYATGHDYGLDRLVLQVPGEWLGLAPVGRMAFFTAMSFVITATSTALASRARQSILAANLAAFLAMGLICLSGAFVFGYLYDSPFLYGGRTIPMAVNTAVGFLAMGVGLVAAVGSRGVLLRPFVGSSVRARLLRGFLPFVVSALAITSWATHWIATSAGGRLAALFSSVATVLALLICGWLCARIATRVGERIEQVEDALRHANDALELRVAVRTRELSQAKSELEVRNRELSEAASDLERTAESVRKAHQDLQAAYSDLQHAESQLVQAEKLSALGQMVAGVAHEINNPLAFVTNNVAVAQRDVGHLSSVLKLYQEAEGTLEIYQHELMSRIHELAERVDLAYVLENLDGLMARSREGLKRISQIVKDLRDFVRLDEGDLKTVDVNTGVHSTLNIIRSLASSRGVTIDADLTPLPEVTCYAAKLNQVILNLIANAIDACASGGHVRVSTRPADGGVEITVTDDGHGIPALILPRIFDPFFTTKPVGKGTGLGLSISQGIVRAHGGTIHCDSTPGLGTRFVVRIPLEPPPLVAEGR